jgi:hypothetical protein
VPRAGSEEAKMAKGEHWYVLRIQAGFETLIVSELRKKNIPVFLAEDHDVSVSVLPPVRISSDIFIFARFSLQNRQTLEILPGLVCIAGVPVPMPLPDQNVSDLQAAVGAGLDMKILMSSQDAQFGLIVNGPLGGRRGKLLKHGGRWLFAVEVPPLERTFGFALPDCSVQLDSAPGN